MCKVLNEFIFKATELFQERGLTPPDGLTKADCITDLLVFQYDYMGEYNRVENNLLSELLIELIPESQLRYGGFLVNPDVIEKNLDIPYPIVLLSDSHPSVRQETYISVRYIGGKATAITAMDGEANLRVQRSLLVGPGCDAYATDVASVTVEKGGTLTALRCPKVTALEGSDILASDSLIEVEGDCVVKAGCGSRVIALGENMDLTLEPGALAVVRHSFPIKGREDAAVIRTVDMDGEMEAEFLERVRSMDSVSRDPRAVDTLPELVELCHDAILRENIPHADIVARGIKGCEDYETLAMLITSHFGRFGDTFPFRAVVDTLPPETLYQNNIFTSRSVPDHITPGKVAHVFGNVTLPEKWVFPTRLHLHDHAVAIGLGQMPIKTWDKSITQCHGASDVVAAGHSFVIADGSTKLETWDNARFYARGLSEVICNGYSNGVLLENARVDAGEKSRMHVKSAGRSTFFDESRALIEDSKASYVAWHKVEVSVLGEPRGQSFDDSVIRTTSDKMTFGKWVAAFSESDRPFSRNISR